MTKFCIQCGAGLADGARFCGECGAAVPRNGAVEQGVAAGTAIEAPVMPTPPSPPAPVFEPDPFPASDQAPEFVAEGDEAQKGPNWLLIGGGLGIVLLLLSYYLLFLRDDMTSSLEDRVQPAATEKAEVVEAKQLFAMTEANIRDKATTQDSSITGKLPRGTAVTGKVILGEDGTSEWLELADGTGFVAVINLGEVEPPQIVKALGDKVWAADKSIDIWSQPDPTSTLVERVAVGTPLTLAGLTANDYIEIKLKKGGVGYVADGARIMSVANGKPIAIAFNPDSCNFGPEIDGLLSAMGDRLRAKFKALENAEYPSDEARDRALVATEGKSTFERLQRNYEGLTVTAIAQHYESTSIYFAEPPAKVIEVFRAKGYKIGRDGQFPSRDLFAGIGATAGEGSRYGKTDLTCGV